MAELTEFALHTTRKYHQFDLSRTDGIFDGSQVGDPFEGYFLCAILNKIWQKS
jgi:hypothetical protein